MNDIFSQIKGYVGPTLKGLVSQFVPDIAKGFMVENLGKVSVEEVISYVETNQSLWGKMTPESREKAKTTIREYASNFDWFTVDWAIEAVRKDLPKLASLFLGWTKARNWLKRQIKEIRTEIGS